MLQKVDVSVAKNYLSESEMSQLQRLVSPYLDVAEDMARREILQDARKVTAAIAKAHAESELFKSDFDRVLKQLEQKQE
ncbi:MAG TPA: RhuM family protein [Sphaerochaeta sp.]|nr:RhuM family protein [Sphaerochaeta sp.]